MNSSCASSGPNSGDTVKQMSAEAFKVPKDIEHTITRDIYIYDLDPAQDEGDEMGFALRELLLDSWTGPISRLATKLKQSRRRAKQKKGPKKRRKTRRALLFRVEKPPPIWLQSQISISRLAEFIRLSYGSDLWDLELALE